MWCSLAKAIRELERTCNEVFDSYRPELYYMRGPGPKWHAKRTGATANLSTSAADGRPAFTEISEIRA